MPRPYDLVAVGRAYTDIIAQVTPEYLARYGLTEGQGKAIPLDQLQVMQGQLHDTRICAGGCTPNSAAVMASLGGKAGFFGKVFKDDIGAFFLEDFAKRGVTLCCDPYAAPSLAASGLSALCLILTTPPHRTFAYNLGCADWYDAQDFAAYDFGQTTFFLIEAVCLESQICRAVLEQAAHAAAAQGALLAYTLQSLLICPDPAFVIDFVMRTADVIFGNRDEVAMLRAHLGGKIPPEMTLVTTLDIDGAMAEQNGVITHVPALAPQPIRNTNGAGDALAAGFLRGHCLGFSVLDCLRLGVRTATAIIEETGGRPTRDLAHLSDLCQT